MARNILIVEDEAPVREQLAETLRDHGYGVTATADGQSALQQLETGAFDLLITDWMIPKRHGLHVVQAVHEKWPDLPIIVVSGYLPDHDAKVLLKGYAEFVQKPVDPETLLSAVRRLLGRP
ncbi:MAG TPA: response regulator [Candidatus Eisenbacteria bacterium]|nr:response regulator [Candidatus Eisenbacteria bacterium]